jgi:patatin-like phospholipase/acyl hydrolase
VIDSDRDKLYKLDLLLISQQLKFKKARPCYQFWTFVGLLLGAVFGLITFHSYKSCNFSIYNRAGLDGLSKKYMGYSTWDKLLIGNLFTPSYEWNSKSPRFYGEHFIREDPGRFNATLDQALSASASSPVAFSPLTLYNGFGIREELVDGGIICNNPSLYAYQTAAFL